MNAYLHDALRGALPTHFVPTVDVPWVASDTPGKRSKLLRASAQGFVELLHMAPGVVMPLHRHTGEVHVYQLSGRRQLCTGEVVGPGDYVYEPAGNVDWWKVIGDEPMLALVVVAGEVEFIGPDGAVRGVANAATQARAAAGR